MASTYSTNLGIELIGTGDQSGTWGATTNTNFGTLVEQAIVGYSTQAVTDSGVATVLLISNGASSTGRNYVITLTGALTAARTVEVPAVNKPYIFFNSTTGGFAVTVKVTGQTGVTIANGKKAIVYTNTTDVIEVANAPATEAGTQTLTNKTLTAPVIATIVNTGTLTLPTSTDTLVGRATTDTLTNKTLTSPLIGTVIGGTTASSSLTLQSTSGVGTSDSILFKVGNNGATTAMTVDTTGNVGIGTISPSTKTVINLTGGTSSYTNPLRLINVAGGASGCEIQFAGTYSATAPDNAFTAGSIGGLTTSGSSNGSGALIFKTQLNGTLSEAMRIDSSGNVGIGTVLPSTKLSVVSAVNGGIAVTDGTVNTIMYSSTGGVSSIGTTTNHPVQLYSNNAARVNIDTSGNVTVGTTSAGNMLRYLDVQNSDAGSSAGSILRFITSNVAASGLTTVDIVKYKTGGFYINNNETDAAAFTAFNVGVSERMRIDSSGNVLVGTTSVIQNGTLSVVGAVIAGSFTNSYSSAGGACLDVTRTSATGDMMYFHTSSAANLAGYITCPTSSTTSYVSVSDYRLKENVTLIATGLEKILALKPVTYDWINDKLQGEGFIAHEVQAVIPLAVVGEKDAVNKDGSIKPQGIDPAKIVVHLVAAIQELEARLAKLETVQ